ncbi:MAG TPA: DUF2795 domain-containing protein [Candidatus Limnocylindrales bacterium]|nr:DUF2795 domain-containing protein [Candidatus Limnocylindrales bacterium]
MTIDRGNTKHGPRLDEEMAHEVKGESRVDEREPAPAGEDLLEEEWTPPLRGGMDTGDDRDPDRRDARARIGAFVPRDVFPAGRSELVEAAREHHAPEGVIAVLDQLPADVTYPGAPELWKALGLHSDR